PVEPLGSAGAFPAFGFLVGASAGTTVPQPPFTGNRLFGAEGGAVISVTGVHAVASAPGGLRLTLDTDAGPVGLATLDVTRVPQGGMRLTLRPPAGLDVASTITTLASPANEGLYGGGTRRDAFDQRGL